jgi:hypothetical protein
MVIAKKLILPQSIDQTTTQGDGNMHYANPQLCLTHTYGVLAYTSREIDR